MEYHPESYWSRVAHEITKRRPSVVAGDDDPFFRYKRRKFLSKFLGSLDVDNKVILEVGTGPGGNLHEIAQNHHPTKILGVDISQNMLDLASNNLKSFQGIELHKIDGQHLPFEDRSVDLSYTVTVLQHNPDEQMLTTLVSELCRVTRDSIVLMEDIGKANRIEGKGSWVGRTVDVYASMMSDGGFELLDVEFLKTKFSRRWHHRIFRIYKSFKVDHEEGDPIGPFTRLVLASPMPITKVLDDVFPDDENLAKLVFRRR